MERSNAIITGMVFGALVGGITTLLLAPKRGQESRELLRGQMGRIRDKVSRNKSADKEELEEVLPSQRVGVDYLH